MKKSIVVNATQEVVWNAIVSYRESQPHRRKIVSKTDRGVIVEESFTGLPVVGTSRVVYEEVEYPFERIEYQQIESDHFSMFHGNWTIAANPDGTCDVELNAEFDITMQIPFKEVILNQLAEMDIEKRLNYLKNKAEPGQAS